MIDLGERFSSSATSTREGDGIEVTLPFAHVWTVRNRRVVRLDAYSDQRQALEAVIEWHLTRGWRPPPTSSRSTTGTRASEPPGVWSAAWGAARQQLARPAPGADPSACAGGWAGVGSWPGSAWLR
jgi:hypothetical protein